MDSKLYEPLSRVEPHLAWSCWDITTVCLVVVAGVYSAGTVLEGLQLGQFASLVTQMDKRNENLPRAIIAFCVLRCLLLILGAARPLRGGKGYDYRQHDPVACVVALAKSADKIWTLKDIIISAGSMSFRLVADTLALIDLYDDADMLSFFIKLFMIAGAATWAAMWVYPQAPTSWMYMPPLGLPSGQLTCLPCCMSLLAFCQLLPAGVLLAGVLFFSFSDTAGDGSLTICPFMPHMKSTKAFHVQ